MNRNALYAIIALTAVWVILRENFLLITVAEGIVISVCCLLFCRRHLPFDKIESVSPLRLALYPFYIIVQVYKAGFNTIRLILGGADAEIIEVKTKLKSSFLRTILANSITLIPGSISLELKDDLITVLWLKGKTEDPRQSRRLALDSGEAVKSKLERILIKMEK